MTLTRLAAFRLVMGLGTLGTFGPLGAALAAAPSSTQSLIDLSLEELATIEITSVSRRPERLSDAAASIYVVTAEAIRRSGATSLPQALRLAPNLQVAQINASEYAISARGFNNAIGNKLLVLIDGRTVYTPFFSGVFWDQQDVMLQDVERIEVISGPGATLWGANAVNGVINVITRSAAETQGGLAVASGGADEARVALRYGAALGEHGHFRVYAKRSHLQNTRTAAGVSLPDGAERSQLGFRADAAAGSDTWTLQGDAHAGQAEPRRLGALPVAAIESWGGNLLGRWTRRWADGANLRVQAYADSSRRDDALLYRPRVDTLDVDVQHDMQLGAHHLVSGGGYRRSRDEIGPGLFFGFRPARRTLRWGNLFVQDGIQLDAKLDLTLGLKVEHNDYTGTEVLPSARLAWKVGARHLLWASLSRAVRAPARLDRDITLPPRPPYIIAGGPDFVSEVAKVAELGWRAQPLPGLSYSATLFVHDWERLRSGQSPPNAQVQNMIDGRTHGVELWGAWQAAPAWRLGASLTTLHEDLRVQPGSSDPTGPSALGNDPSFQWTLRSTFELSAEQELEVDLRRVAALPNPALPAYTALDVRWEWRLPQGVSVAMVGRNLLDPGHAEFGAAADRAEIERSLRLQLRWPF